MNYHLLYNRILLGMILLCLQSCSNFLETKPDTKLAIPNTFEDCQALLDGYGTVNTGYPYVGELCADNFSINQENWSSLGDYEDRMLYIWDKETSPIITQWASPYQTVFIANQVLSILKELSAGNRREQLEGASYFYRAYALFSLAEIFAPVPKKDGSNADLPALPYRTTPNVEEKSVRVTLKEYFDLLLQDLEQAENLLPMVNGLPSRPSKTAAAALLSRIYLYMQDYEKALRYTNKALINNSKLMDYNTLRTEEESPFKQFNEEVIFQAISTGTYTYYYTVWKVAPDFLQSYADHDLRKNLLFMENEDNTYSFKGNYDGEFNQAPFSGLAVDELILTKAECLVRSNQISEALTSLNSLLEKRYRSSTFEPIEIQDPAQLLQLILEERRKELVMRQRRWPDLKRLNLNSQTATVLTRQIGDKEYQLLPNDPFYTFLIPQEIINNSTLTQTIR
ncbi:membrane protein [Sphingobacterium faecium NBRC 15299]|uniref:RagB/SusD family nutrient uptake outer membrane protein n=1 Tax=Sphingobacterium faecium TaxID=34087 RepID=UPI000D38DB9D|nr:RagB/SusD family nutrient uptake outer membrane protein [Sphingobacterium faecium]PTX10168.1 SusD-like starch-binding protein associating with outer membrane [Sphingobacterium faecium]GEM65971.1 membrane protein [Sphingobacterium faecium NBRC 15299]